MINRKFYAFLIFCLVLAGCASGADKLVVMTHDSFAISESTITAFEQENQIDVVFLPSGDAGSTLNRAILAKNSPVADILYGIDNTFLSRALDEDLFEVYDSPMLSAVPEEFKLDAENRATPVNFGDVCINYDRKYFEEQNLPVPASFDDLLHPSYTELLVVENPATSSPGLAFLLATIAEYGPDGYLLYWTDLRENGVVVVNDWETAYYSNFSGSAGQGAQPMVVSYGTSPAAEVFFSEESLSEAPTASIAADNMCFRQVEFAGILKGTKNRKAAERFINYMLSVPFQEDIPLNMFVFPVNHDANLPQVFLDHMQVPEQPATLDPEMVSLNRESWVEAWRELMLE